MSFIKRLLSDDSDGPTTVESAAVISSRETPEIKDPKKYAEDLDEALVLGARKRPAARRGSGQAPA
jgi:hypothetical protein